MDTEEVNAFKAVAWDRISEILRTHGMVRHQRESFDYFTNTLLPYIVSENSDCWSTEKESDRRHVIHFRNVHLMRPSVQEFDGFEQEITPHMCRMRGMSYSSNVMVEAVHDVLDTAAADKPALLQRTVYPDILLCRLPIMVNSSLCHLRTHANGRATECAHDEGGYFIIKCAARYEPLSLLEASLTRAGARAAASSARSLHRRSCVPICLTSSAWGLPRRCASSASCAAVWKQKCARPRPSPYRRRCHRVRRL